jgi:hypothetical protein
MAVEPLPSSDDRRRLLFYEASEGGAGVLISIVSKNNMLSLVARKALEIMHYEVPETINSVSDLKERQDENQPCIAGCYRCLLSYYNQPEHAIIDRRNEKLKEILVALAKGSVVPYAELSGGAAGRSAFQDNANTSENIVLTNFLSSRGFKTPDVYDYQLMEHNSTAKGLYRNDKILLYFENPDSAVKQYAADRGYRIVVLGETEEAWNKIAGDETILPRVDNRGPYDGD